MAAVLPNPSMDFVPLDQLPASDLDKLVQNIEYLNTYINANMASITVTTTDPGEGAALAQNTLLAVVAA